MQYKNTSKFDQEHETITHGIKTEILEREIEIFNSYTIRKNNYLIDKIELNFNKTKTEIIQEQEHIKPK